MTLFNLQSLINAPTCFQSEKPRCIDLILTNKRVCLKIPLFKKRSELEYLITTSLRRQYIQGNPKTKFYRDYKSPEK